MASLIQERMAIDRAIRSGRLWIVFGALFVALWCFIGFADQPTFVVVAEIALGVYFAARGVRMLRRAHEAERTFNAEHGENAGKQQPV